MEEYSELVGNIRRINEAGLERWILLDRVMRKKFNDTSVKLDQMLAAMVILPERTEEVERIGKALSKIEDWYVPEHYRVDGGRDQLSSGATGPSLAVVVAELKGWLYEKDESSSTSGFEQIREGLTKNAKLRERLANKVVNGLFAPYITAVEECATARFFLDLDEAGSGEDGGKEEPQQSKDLNAVKAADPPKTTASSGAPEDGGKEEPQQSKDLNAVKAADPKSGTKEDGGKEVKESKVMKLSYEIDEQLVPAKVKASFEGKPLPQKYDKELP
ncbi:unnamed protein product, partial [Mesorhabditis spiculigera]